MSRRAGGADGAESGLPLSGRAGHCRRYAPFPSSFSIPPKKLREPSGLVFTLWKLKTVPVIFARRSISPLLTAISANGYVGMWQE